MPPGVVESEDRMNSRFDQKLNRLVLPSEKNVDLDEVEDGNDYDDYASENSAF